MFPNSKLRFDIKQNIYLLAIFFGLAISINVCIFPIYKSYAQTQYKMIVIGDSIAWGQGLLPEQKYPSLIEKNIRSQRPDVSVSKTILAHSGAIIGPGWEYKFNWNAIPGQDNVKLLKILKQNSIVDTISSILRQYRISAYNIDQAKIAKINNDRTIEIGRQCIILYCFSLRLDLDNTMTSASMKAIVTSRQSPNVIIFQKVLDNSFTVRKENAMTMVYHFGKQLPGEVPNSFPTEREQVDLYTGATNDVNLILVSGCINDVDVRTITNPLTSSSKIQNLVESLCHVGMKQLLSQIAAKFSSQSTKIIVTGYYPVLSENTDFNKLPPLAQFFSIQSPITTPIKNQMILNWHTFSQHADAALQAAVQEVNQQLSGSSAPAGGTTASKRLFFVSPGFTDRNSMYAQDSFIFGPAVNLGSIPPISPTDPVAQKRFADCRQVYGLGLFSPISSLTCRLASTGHPNEKGDVAYATHIMPLISSSSSGGSVGTGPGGGGTTGGLIQEDCITFDPTTASAQNIQGRWKVVTGGNVWMLDFGSSPSSQDNAQKAVSIIKQYKFASQCFVGRPNPAMQYYLTSSGSSSTGNNNNNKAPSGTFAGQDCISFNPITTTVQQIGASWKVVDGSHWILDFGTSQDNANKALSIIKKYGFSQICFVGRPNPPMMYFLSRS